MHCRCCAGFFVSVLASEARIVEERKLMARCLLVPCCTSLSYDRLVRTIPRAFWHRSLQRSMTLTLLLHMPRL